MESLDTVQTSTNKSPFRQTPPDQLLISENIKWPLSKTSSLCLPELALALAGQIKIKTNKIESGGMAAVDKSKLVAESGSTVYAEEGTSIIAKENSTVYAERGAVVVAHKGAIVFARSGSIIYAHNGTTVNGAADPTIHQDKGAKVIALSKAIVNAYKDAVVETTYGKINAYDGSTVYARCAYLYGSPTQPPTITAKGKCTIFATKGASIEIRKGAEAIIKNWNGQVNIGAKLPF